MDIIHGEIHKMKLDDFKQWMVLYTLRIGGKAYVRSGGCP